MRPAPDFNLPDQDGKLHSLKDYAGSWLVLYFYPKDDTSGCTKEACNFRDQRSEIEDRAKAKVVGVSKDSVASHKQFADKYHLPFTLLSDTDHQVIEAYGSWKPLSFMGKQYIGTQRNSFVIDPNGMIVKEYTGVDPKTHTEQIISDLKALQS